MLKSSNAGGDLAGRYADSSGKIHGFLLSTTEQHEPYQARDARILGSRSGP